MIDKSFVVDTSAIVAISFAEKERAVFVKIIDESYEVFISSATFVELCAVFKRGFGEKSVEEAEKILEILSVKVSPFTSNQASIAARAYREFPVLNLGDSYSYALAKEMDLPLLFKGNDFSQTDLRLVEY